MKNLGNLPVGIPRLFKQNNKRTNKKHSFLDQQYISQIKSDINEILLQVFQDYSNKNRKQKNKKQTNKQTKIFKIDNISA